jgi:hypothetical protein
MLFPGMLIKEAGTPHLPLSQATMCSETRLDNSLSYCQRAPIFSHARFMYVRSRSQFSWLGVPTQTRKISMDCSGSSTEGGRRKPLLLMSCGKELRDLRLDDQCFVGIHARHLAR